MGWIFGNEKLPINDAEMIWLEEKFLELKDVFGNEFQSARGFLYPIFEQFPYDNLHDRMQLAKLGKQLADLLFVPREFVSVDLFIEKLPEPVGTPLLGTSTNNLLAWHEVEVVNGNKFCRVMISEKILNDPTKVVYLIVKRLSYFKMEFSEFVIAGKLAAVFADVMVIYFGFGIFLENIRLVKTTYNKNSLGDLPIGQIAAGCALYAKLSACAVRNAEQLFHPNTKSLFQRSMKYIEKNGFLFIDEKEWNQPTDEMAKVVRLRERKNDFDAREKNWEELVKVAPHNFTYLHNLSYARLCNRKYALAIEGFDRCIAEKNTVAFAYNNRGFCKLMLGDLEGGLYDIQKSIDMQSDNSFAIRNLGVYYLRKEEFQKALNYFEKSFQMDTKTELIHFYLGCAHVGLNESEKARLEFEQSRAIPEMPVPEYPHGF